MYKLFDGMFVIRLTDGEKVSTSSIEYFDWISSGGLPQPADMIDNPRLPKIIEELRAIDMASIRPLRDGETDRINELKNKSAALRLELQSTPAKIDPLMVGIPAQTMFPILPIPFM